MLVGVRVWGKPYRSAGALTMGFPYAAIRRRHACSPCSFSQ
jgi:hypothetical protein